MGELDYSLPRGVRRIEVPTPFPVGPVNTYLIEGEALTLVDAGPRAEDARQALAAGLRAHGYGLEDIGQLVLTHGHIDHAGMAGEIAQLSGAEVFIHSEDRHRVTDHEGYLRRRVHEYLSIIERGGVPEHVRTTFRPGPLLHYFLQYGVSCPGARPLDDGDTLDTGAGAMQVVWTPGHSRGSVCLVLDGAGVIFTGDHVLGDISSNPSLDFDSPVDISMLTYMDSLERVAPYAGLLALPGHRAPIADLGARLDQLREEYRTKLQRLAEWLNEDPVTLYEVSRVLYGDYRWDSLVMALAESLDLARILEREGHARVEEVDGVTTIRAT